MTPAQTEKALDKAREAYWAEVDRIAAEARARYVVPFCNRHGVKFSAGMGSWSFHGKACGRGSWGSLAYGLWNHDDRDRLGVRLVSVLEAETLPGQCLGSLMQDYTPPNYRE